MSMSSRVRLVVLAVGVLCGSVFGQYEGGGGTPGDPYLISTAVQMNAIGANFPDWAKHFKLTANINLGGYTGTAFNIIGNTSTPFTGTFDGNGRTISNFTYTSTGTDNIGLFGYLSTGAEIVDLNLVKPDVKGGTGVNIGTLVGLNGDFRVPTFGAITRCTVTDGNVNGGWSVGGLVGNNVGPINDCSTDTRAVVLAGGDFAGGLVGTNDGTISNCTAIANVGGVGAANNIGGLVGLNDLGTISDSYAAGEVSGYGNVGGLVGWNASTINTSGASGTVRATTVGQGYKGSRAGGLVGLNDRGINPDIATISNSHATGQVNGGYSTGGLVGTNTGASTISNCYATSTVMGTSYVGGLVGNNFNSETVSNSYAIGAVSGESEVGGLVGWNNATISDSFAAGQVTGSGTNLGGLVGMNSSGTITTSFWDTQSSGQTTSDGGTGKTTAQMRTIATFTGASWDFLDETANGTEDVWRMCANGVWYPKLSWEYPAGDFVCPDGVGLYDLAVFVQAWASGAGDVHWNPACDLHMDEHIDLLDFGVLGANWNWQADFSLLGYWAMDESGGSTAEDSSAYGRNATLLNMEEDDWVDGNVGGGLAFDGVDDFVEVDGWKGILGAHSRTTSAWIRTTATGGRIINWGAAGPGYRWTLFVDATGRFAMGVGGADIVGTAVVSDGEWHHVAAVLTDDGSPNINEVKLYVDGLPDELSSSAPDRAINTLAGSDVTIGQYYSIATSFFEGTIDEMRIYDRALGLTQIRELIGLSPIPEGVWSFDEGSGLTASNSSGDGRDGTLINMDDTDWVQGEVGNGNALEFDGVDDFVEIAGWKGILGSQPRTVCAWIKTTTGGMITNWGTDAPGSRWSLLVLADGRLGLAIGGNAVLGSAVITDDQWHHVAAVSDGSTVANIKLYIDGVQETPSSQGDMAIYTQPGGNVTIGKFTTGQHFAGTIDEVRIYDGALTAEEIGNLASP